MAQASNTQGGHSIKNDGNAPSSAHPSNNRGGSNSARVPAQSAPTAASGGSMNSNEGGKGNPA